MTFSDMQVNEFVEEIAAGNATPGGGSVAAVAGAFGAALEEMVCNLTIGKDGYGEVETDLEEFRDELGVYRERLLELADEDSAAFDAIMDAYRTPEEENRAEAIQEASKHATEVPLETAEVCLSVLELAEPVTEKGNENAITDGGTGGHLAHAALQAALYNVQINLETIEDDEFVEAVEERTEDIEAAATEALAQLTATVSPIR